MSNWLAKAKKTGNFSDKDDSGFYFKTGQDHNCGDITKLPVHCLIYLLTSLL